MKQSVSTYPLSNVQVCFWKRFVGLIYGLGDQRRNYSLIEPMRTIHISLHEDHGQEDPQKDKMPYRISYKLLVSGCIRGCNKQGLTFFFRSELNKLNYKS